MKKIFILLVIIFLSGCSQTPEQKSAKINNHKINIEIADTPEEQYRGLSERENLCENCGMLFQFPDKRKVDFVMRDMKFDLDIIWISDNKIIEIDRNLPAEGSEPKNIYNSDSLINQVLEVNAGFCDQNNIKTGDLIVF